MSNASDRTAEAGIGILQTKIPKLLQYIFRPQPLSDFGIDAEIETTAANGEATGRLVAAQVKSGKSYFSEDTGAGFVFRGEQRHLEYWRTHSLPVIVILVDVDDEVAYWAEVDDSAVTTGARWKIEVPKSQVIDGSAKKALADIANKLPDEVAETAKRDYESARERHLEGRRRSALQDLAARVKQPTWRFASHAVQAEAYRALAQWSYVQTADRARAETYLLQARTVEPTSDETVVRALMKARDEGLEAALPLLAGAKTASAMNLRALFLACSHRSSEARTVLDAWPDGVERTPETARVEALTALGMKDLGAARERIAAAMFAKPRWAGIRETYALIEYASSLPLSEVPEPGKPIPKPVPPQLLRHDDESLAHLRRAADMFAELASEAEDAADRNRFETWHLAALANDPVARPAAMVLAESLAMRDTISPMAAYWILQRALVADPDALLNRVLGYARTTKVAAGPDDAALVFLAIQRLSSLNRHAEAGELLRQHEGDLKAANPDAWHFWRALVAHAEKESALAASEIALIARDDMREVAQEAITALPDEDWRAQAMHLLETYQTNGDVSGLLDYLRAHAAHREWDVVLAHADELLALLPNVDVLQMICEAAYQLGEFRRCLQFLDRWDMLSTKRTEGLEQTRVACLLHVDPLAAARAARRLVQEHPSSTNSVAAMTAYLRIGDLKACSLEARRLLDDAAVDSATLLNAIQVTAPEDRRLAVALFRKALEQGFDDDDVGSAFSAAHQLGLDDETATLTPRMQRLAAEGRGGFKAITLPELLKFGEERQSQVAEIAAKFHAGELPIHIVARTLGWTLAEVFHVWADDNLKEPSPLRHRPLMTRTGALGPARIDGLAAGAVSMDTTAFFLAGRLDILDVVERTYAPISVSRFLPAVIFEQQRRLGDVQASRIDEFKRVIELVEGKKLSVMDDVHDAPPLSGHRGVDAFLHGADNDATYVEQLPLTDFESKARELPPEVASRIVNLGDYIAAATRQAIITDEAAERAGVGVPLGSKELDHWPEKVVLSYVATSALARSDALAQLAEATDVSVSSDFVQEARATLAWLARRRTVVDWLEGLRERLRVGLEKGTYVTVGEAPVEIDDVRDLDMKALVDILKHAQSSMTAAWVEDRFCSRMGGVGIVDVLADLRAHDQLPASAHAALTHRLRLWDARYLAVDRKDLVHCIGRTRDRKLPDSPEIVAISRYVAATALDSNRGNGTDRPPEIDALIETARGFGIAAAEIWKQHLDNRDRAREHSAWFMTHVYFGRAALRAASDPLASAETAMSDTAADLAQLYMAAVILGLSERPDDWSTSATAEYVWWLSSSFALRKFFTNPPLVEATAQALAALAHSFVEQEELEGIEIVIRGVFESLPEELQHAWVRLDAGFWKRLGIGLTDRINVDGEDVPTDAFWKSLECAVAGAAAPENDVALKVDRTASVIRVNWNDKTLTIKSPLFVLFAIGGKTAMQWTIDHPDVFDMSVSRREAEGHRIASLPSARERVMAAEELRSAGGSKFYAEFRQQLRGGGSLPESAFHLRIASLRDHLRRDVPDREKAATELVADAGLENALRRLVTLPLQMPRAVAEVLDTTNERRDLLRRLANSVAAPLSKMHVAALALRYGGEDAELLALGKEIVATLLSAEYQQDGFGAFQHAALVVNSWLSFDQDAATTSTEDRLTFSTSHASRLIDILGPASLAKAYEFFKRVTAAARETLSRDPEFYDHALYPTNFDYGRLVIGGISTLTADLPDEVRSEVRPLIEAALQRLHDAKEISRFFVDETLLHGASSTFLAQPAGANIMAIATNAPVTLPSTDVLRKATKDLLDAAASAPANDTWAPVLATIISQHQLPVEERGRVRTILERLAQQEIRKDVADRDVVVALKALVGQTLADDELRALFTDSFVGVAREFAEGTRDQTIFEELAPAFVEIAFTLAARPGEPLESARELVQMIDDLVRVWPKLAHAAATRLSPILWTVPVEQSVSLWRVLLRARESAT